MKNKMIPILKKFNSWGMYLQFCCVFWIFVVITMPLNSDALFVDDSCTMKSQPGICKLASECPELEMAVRAGTFSARDIVNCGFATHEEIICCPAGRGVNTTNRQSALSTTLPTITTSTTTTEASQRDFWSHLLTTTSDSPIDESETTTTAKPDFWLHLLNTTTATTSTTTTTTTTTTVKPLIINGKEIDPNTRFIDLTAMLSGNNRQDGNNGDSSRNQNIPNQNPESINDRMTGWQSPPIGLPSPTVNWNNPRSRQMSPPNRFHNTPRNPQQIWPADPSNMDDFASVQQPFQTPMQGNNGQNIPNQISFTFPNPSSVLNEPQSLRFPTDDQFGPAIQQSRPDHAFGAQQSEWPVNNNNQQFNAPQQLEWQENNDFSQRNPISEGVWPNNGVQNAAIQNPVISNIPFFNQAIKPLTRTTRATLIAKTTKNPIELINEKLRKAGIEVVRGTLENVETYHEDLRKTSTPRTRIDDPFAPLQFRPQREQNSVAAENKKNFDRKPIWGISKSSTRKPQIPREGSTRATVTTSSTTLPPVTQRTSERPAVVACREIDAGLSYDITPHILGGTPAELGEFPHMAAIGYSSIGNDQGPYDYRCGGTLIAKRFVLTAAHCVNSRDSQPAVVLLGLININDEDERANAEEVPIRQVHIHPEYSNSRTYHDVAILELERDVRYSSSIYPTCLYTDLNDPPSSANLYVTGWGQISTSTRQKSNILLKAKLQLVPVSQCNASYVEMGLNRRISQGVQLQQMCAHDPGFTRDACQGDSGGPLNLVADESINKYRIIGVISAGFSCGSATPGLYARVAAYLDFIESVAWPNQS